MIEIDEIIENANRLHNMIYSYQNCAGENSLEVQKLTMLADELREAIIEYKESLEQ